MISLYKRNAQGKPLVWRAKESIKSDSPAGPISYIDIEYGLVGGNLHKETISITKKNVNELQSRVNAKRKEGYKELSELKDSNTLAPEYNPEGNNIVLRTYLDLYLRII